MRLDELPSKWQKLINDYQEKRGTCAGVFRQQDFNDSVVMLSDDGTSLIWKDAVLFRDADTTEYCIFSVVHGYCVLPALGFDVMVHVGDEATYVYDE